MKGKIYDPNFLKVDTVDEATDWYKVTREGFDIYGSVPDGELLTLRMPREVAATVNKRVLGQCVYGAGVRLRLKTNSKRLSFKVEYGEGRVPSVCTATLCFGFDIYRLEGNKERYIHTFCPPSENFDGESATYSRLISRDENEYTYTVNFPHYASVKSITLGLDKGATLKEGDPYVNEAPIVFYGSSITHGASASNPGNTYENFISHKYNYDYVNLGFAGSACGEITMADYIAGLDMSLFVFDYDHNAKTPEDLENTHFKMYEAVRRKNPTVPYIMITRPDFWTQQNMREHILARRDVIMRSYLKARELGDKNVYFIDGLSFNAGEYKYEATVDGIHPGDHGFVNMARCIGDVVKYVLTLE